MVERSGYYRVYGGSGSESIRAFHISHSNRSSLSRFSEWNALSQIFSRAITTFYDYAFPTIKVLFRDNIVSVVFLLSVAQRSSNFLQYFYTSPETMQLFHLSYLNPVSSSQYRIFHHQHTHRIIISLSTIQNVNLQS